VVNAAVGASYFTTNGCDPFTVGCEGTCDRFLHPCCSNLLANVSAFKINKKSFHFTCETCITQTTDEMEMESEEEEDSNDALAKPGQTSKEVDNPYTSMFSKAHKGMVVSGYAQTKRVTLYPTLEMAMEACIKYKSAMGITFEPDIQAYTLRKSTVVRKSPIKAEISWLQL